MKNKWKKKQEEEKLINGLTALRWVNINDRGNNEHKEDQGSLRIKI